MLDIYGDPILLVGVVLVPNGHVYVGISQW